MIKRRHAAVVQVRVVRPYTGQRGGGISLARFERAFCDERARIERLNKAVRHDIATPAIRSDIGMHARPPHVALAVVFAMASGATEFFRVKELASFFRERRVDLVGIAGWPQM